MPDRRRRWRHRVRADERLAVSTAARRLPSLGAYLVIVMLAATVPLAAMLAYQLFRDLQDQQLRLHEGLQRSTAVLANAVQSELATTVDELTALAGTLQRTPAAERAAVLRHALQEPRRAHWQSVFMRGAEGLIIASGSTRALPPRAAAGQDATVSDLVGDGPALGTMVEVPVAGDGELRQTLGAWIDASQWQRLVQNAGAPPSGFLGLVGRDGRLIARSDAPQLAGRTVDAAALAAMAADGAGTQRAELAEGGLTYGAWQTLPLSGWGVGARVFAEPIERAQRRALLTALTTTTACLLLGVALASLLARRVTEPLIQLARSGPALSAPPLVHEIAQLRNALAVAQEQEARARAHLQRQADEFQALFASTPVGLAFMPDAASPRIVHNPAMQALVGTRADGETAAVEVFDRERMLSADEQPLRRAAATGRAVGPVELELRCRGSPTRHVLVRALPLQGGAQRTQGAVAAVVDITERKLAEQRLLDADRRLRESHDLIELAQDAGAIGFFQYRFDSGDATWSPGQARLFGFDAASPPPAAALLQRVHADHRDALVAQLRAMVAATRERETFECCVELPDGTSHWLSTRVMLSYDDQRRPKQLVGVSLDISQQKTAERERAALVDAEQTARRQAEAANRAKDEFLAMLGHELRNPLGAIASAVEVLNRVGAGDDVAINARRIIGRQTRHLAHLMDDLLDVGRVISGKVRLSLRRLELGALIERAVATFDVTGQSRGHDLRLDLERAWVDADVTRLEQVITNLLGNAFKYTPPGRRIDVCLRCRDTQALIEVRDQGPGIDPALLPRIFDLFVQDERPIDRPGGGLGIGLTLVRRLVELHGGEVTAHSSSAGTTFQVWLPRVDAPPLDEQRSARAPSAQRRVLLVEDNADVLSVMRSMLELDGHVVHTASDGERGLAALLQQRPDVAIVDIGLPGLSGYEVARRSRRAGFAGKLFAVSGYSGPNDVAEARRHGFDAHLAKPLDPQRLHELLTTP